MKSSFVRWFIAVLLCAVFILPARAQDTAAANADKLTTVLQNVLAAIKAGDTHTAEKLIDGFMLPHPEQWFEATFGSQEAPALEKVFAKLQPNQSKDLMDRLSWSVKNGKTDVDVRVSSATVDADARLLEAAASAMKTPAPIYSVRMANGANDTGATRPGFFVFVDGGFRYLSPQVLHALSTAPPMRVSMGGNIAARNLINRVEPKYPASAGEGVIKLHVLIGADGVVAEVTPIGTGDATLTQAAIDAVKQWRYKPVTLNGKPVEVQTEVDVTFSRH